MKTIYCVIFLAFILASCAPSGSQVQEVLSQTQVMWTQVPTQTSYPTHTPYPTYTALPPYTPQPTIVVEVTRIVMVTQTSTATPLYTPTITNTPTNPPNATQTAEALELARLTADKRDGFYLVNVDIAPGVWRSTGTADDCYWEITDKTGDILDNHFGMSGGTAYIAPTAFQVEFDDCGTWVYISPP